MDFRRIRPLPSIDIARHQILTSPSIRGDYLFTIACLPQSTQGAVIHKKFPSELTEESAIRSRHQRIFSELSQNVTHAISLLGVHFVQRLDLRYWWNPDRSERESSPSPSPRHRSYACTLPGARCGYAEFGWTTRVRKGSPGVINSARPPRFRKYTR